MPRQHRDTTRPVLSGPADPRTGRPKTGRSMTTALELDGREGLLVRPASARWLYVLAHGAGAGMRHDFMEALAEALAARDVATVRWEFPYMAAGKPRPDS